MAAVKARIKTISKTLTCKEWERLAVEAKQADRLCALGKRASKQLKAKPPVLERTIEGVEAQQVVGILAIPSVRLEILPKIDGEDDEVRAALVRMLSASQNLRVADGELTALLAQRHDLLEIFIGLFANRLLAAVRRGLPYRYMEQEEDLKRLRGKLDVTRQLTRLALRPDLLACRFDEFSENTPLNRVLKAAVARLTGVARSAANRRCLAEISSRFEFVGETSDPLREQVRLDRTNLVFHNLYRLALLFLKGDWQTTTSGDSLGFALLFPMNELFENFIGQCLKRTFPHREVGLQGGRRRRSVLIDADNKHLFRVQPDAVIGDRAMPGAGDPPIILDTKWKPLKPNASDGKFGVSQSDVYQMLAYAQAYDAQHLILLYPWQREMGIQKGVACNWTIAGTERRLCIATVDVSRPRKEVIGALGEIMDCMEPPVSTKAA